MCFFLWQRHLNVVVFSRSNTEHEDIIQLYISLGAVDDPLNYPRPKDPHGAVDDPMNCNSSSGQLKHCRFDKTGAKKMYGTVVLNETKLARISNATSIVSLYQ